MKIDEVEEGKKQNKKKGTVARCVFAFLVNSSFFCRPQPPRRRRHFLSLAVARLIKLSDGCADSVSFRLKIEIFQMLSPRFDFYIRFHESIILIGSELCQVSIYY